MLFPHKSSLFYIYFAISSVIWQRRGVLDKRFTEKIIFSVLLRIARVDRGSHIFPLSLRSSASVFDRVCGGFSFASPVEEAFGSLAYSVPHRGGRVGDPIRIRFSGVFGLSDLEDGDGDRHICRGSTRRRKGTA